jgi:hypothetical protein
MKRFLQYSAVPPVLLGLALSLGITFAWLGLLCAALAIFAPFSDPRVTLVLLFSPFILALSVFLFVPLEISAWESRIHQFWDFQSVLQFLPILLTTLFLAALFSVRCYHRQRRNSAHHTISWMVFVLLLGWPGLIGYALHRRWPVLVCCPNCGAETPRDRDTCAKCNAAFPPPALKGIEVFA